MVTGVEARESFLDPCIEGGSASVELISCVRPPVLFRLVKSGRDHRWDAVWQQIAS